MVRNAGATATKRTANDVRKEQEELYKRHLRKNEELVTLYHATFSGEYEELREPRFVVSQRLAIKTPEGRYFRLDRSYRFAEYRRKAVTDTTEMTKPGAYWSAGPIRAVECAIHRLKAEKAQDKERYERFKRAYQNTVRQVKAAEACRDNYTISKVTLA